MSKRDEFEQFITETPLTRWADTSIAVQCAWIAHEGQVDKAGRDYLESHVSDVVNRLDGELPSVRAVAWLHDVLEDSDITEDQLRRVFSAEVVDAVVALTRRQREYPDDYYARVKANPTALRVKLADIASNTDPERMALLAEATRERLTRKYAHALEVLQ